MTETVRFGKLAGVEVGVNASVLVILLLITLGLAVLDLPGRRDLPDVRPPGP